MFAIIPNPTVSRWNDIMRVSEGVPIGRFVEVFTPEMFNKREEVIVFTRNEFDRTYNSMREQINYVNETYLHFNRDEDWKLIGYWPKIMDKVYILEVNINSIFKKELQQSYLDAYIYDVVQNSEKKVSVSEKECTGTNRVSNLDLLI